MRGNTSYNLYWLQTRHLHLKKTSSLGLFQSHTMLDKGPEHIFALDLFRTKTLVGTFSRKAHHLTEWAGVLGRWGKQFGDTSGL